MPGLAAPTGGSGPPRRLHGIHRVGPFLRKLCPAGQTLVGKEGEAVSFQNRGEGWGRCVKAPNGIFFFPAEDGEEGNAGLR